MSGAASPAHCVLLKRCSRGGAHASSFLLYLPQHLEKKISAHTWQPQTPTLVSMRPGKACSTGSTCGKQAGQGRTKLLPEPLC